MNKNNRDLLELFKTPLFQNKKWCMCRSGWITSSKKTINGFTFFYSLYFDYNNPVVFIDNIKLNGEKIFMSSLLFKDLNEDFSKSLLNKELSKIYKVLHDKKFKEKRENFWTEFYIFSGKVSKILISEKKSVLKGE